jgi:hypothetical protein
MKRDRDRHPGFKALSLVCLLVLSVACGCSEDGALAPESPSVSTGDPAGWGLASNVVDPALSAGPGEVAPGMRPGPASLVPQAQQQFQQDGDGHDLPSDPEETWKDVASKDVEPGEATQVTGSRYVLTLDETSVSKRATITIKERSPDVVDVELGPDGMVFESPVLLEIDYAGTANDPDSPDHHGLRPAVFWFNPKAKTWHWVPGFDDEKRRVYSVWLDHFSRYAMWDGAGLVPGPKHREPGKTDDVQSDEIQWN